MAKTTEKGSVDAAVTMSPEDMLKLVQSLEAANASLMVDKARADALHGVRVEYVPGGVSKKGYSYAQHIQITGADFGFPGIKLTPEKWDTLMRIADTVTSIVDEHRDKFTD